eukprot:SAG31_NODE_4108_length_3576_cov_1.978142_4_plen_221_part_01
MTTTAANSAIAWTHDIGGFIPQPLHTDELFLRWVQYGVFSPVFRTHCAGCELRPWMFGNYVQLKPVYQLRNSLVPYLYSAAFAATTSGVLAIHPLYYDWPEENEAYAFSEWREIEQTKRANQSGICLTAPKSGYGADDGQAGKPRNCDQGSWCNGFRTSNASACASACCAVKDNACGGYTWDPKQADASGGSRCPVGEPCCWLKQVPSALGKGPARFQGAV